MSDLASHPVVALLYRVIVDAHVAAGTIALFAFWIAGLARKARGLHVQAGSIYLMAMRGILVTAVPLAAMAFAKGDTARGVFLLYLVMLVATTVVTAPRAIRMKRDFDGFRRGGYRVLAYALPASAFAAFVFGIVNHAPLLWGFSITGFVVASEMHRTMRRKRAEPGWWLKQHYRAMIGNGVGTHIAFLSIGLSHALPREYAATVQNLAWFGPLTIAFFVRFLLDRSHRRKFGHDRTAGAVGNAPGVAA